MSRILAIAAVAVFLALGASFKCVAADFKYTPISGVTQSVNDLGKNIAQEQAKVVTPGGNEYAPGYSAVDQTNFEASGKLTKIVAALTGSDTFKLDIAAFKTLTEGAQAKALDKMSVPIWPTWAMNGRIDSTGTTDAGYAVESEIISAMVKAIKAAL